jgi:Kef-type K+ transport system membrane component KefB
MSSFSQNTPILLLLGFTILIGYIFGKYIKFLKLPSIIGFMTLGVILGPSFLNLHSEAIQSELSFITEIALGFVALSIGLELKLSILKQFGKSIIYIIIFESFGAFLVVFTGIYLTTKNVPLALIFASIAPASAPAGTVAIIQEYKAKGTLTKALYAVVGFDDGLGIIIFGFAAAIANSILVTQSGGAEESTFMLMLEPLKEIIFSILLGGGLSFLFALMSKKIESVSDITILAFGFIFVSLGICSILNLSLILTNMVFGMVLINTQSQSLIRKLHEPLPLIMPLLFILFFTLAGANLHISSLPALGVIGVVYILGRTIGLMSGAFIGGTVGKAEPKIKKYLGMGILSQAGVAIGLALIVKSRFAGLGKVISNENGVITTNGDYIGSVIITTVTATCIFFELIGPILTKIALKKAGEIK